MSQEITAVAQAKQIWKVRFNTVLSDEQARALVDDAVRFIYLLQKLDATDSVPQNESNLKTDVELVHGTADVLGRVA